MFLNATYKVRADEKDFPYIGQILEGELEGIKVSTVVREIQKVKWYNPDWQEKGEIPICILQLLVQVDEAEFARKKRKEITRSKNKLVILDGGMADNKREMNGYLR